VITYLLKTMPNIFYWTYVIPTTTSATLFMLGLAYAFAIQTNLTQQLKYPTKIEHRKKNYS
jgi:hypothetical protein